MINNNSLLFFTFLWIVGLVYLYRLYNLHYKLNSSDYDIFLAKPNETAERFPEWYKFFTLILVFIFISISILLSIFVVPYFMDMLQKILYDNNSYVFVAPNAMILSSVFSFILAITMCGLVFKKVINFFPKLERYQALSSFVNRNTIGYKKEQIEKAWSEALLKIDTSKLNKFEWGLFMRVACIVWFFTIPAYFFVVDEYYKFNQDKIIVNSLFSIKETENYLTEIESVNIYLEITKRIKNNQKDKFNLNTRFEILMKDSSIYEIWNGLGIGMTSTEKLISIIEILKSAGVEIIYYPITYEQELLLSKYNEDAQQEVRKLFLYLDGHNE